jgi:hypothetical protein
MEDHHSDPHLRDLPGLQPEALVPAAEPAAHKQAVKSAGCFPDLQEQHNRPVLPQDYQFSFREAEGFLR